MGVWESTYFENYIFDKDCIFIGDYALFRFWSHIRSTTGGGRRDEQVAVVFKNCGGAATKS